MKRININWERIEAAVGLAEWRSANTGPLTGEEKRAMAINIIDAVINLPFPWSLADRWVYGLLIDLVVYLYNKWFGKRWARFLNPVTHLVTPMKAMQNA